VKRLQDGDTRRVLSEVGASGAQLALNLVEEVVRQGQRLIGCQLGASCRIFDRSSGCRPEPSAFTTYTCFSGPVTRTNAICFPSGDQTGAKSYADPRVTLR